MENIISSISNKIFEWKISRLAKKGQYQEARQQIRQRSSSKQSDLKKLTSLAILYKWEGDSDQVLETSRQIITYPYSDEEEYALARWRISRLLSDMRRYDEALDSLSFCLDYWPENDRVLALKASLLLSLNQVDAALEHYQHVLEIDDKNHDAISELVDIYWEIGEEDRAFVLIEKYLKDYPDFALAQYLMANLIHNTRGDPRSSLPFYEEALLLSQKTSVDHKSHRDHNSPELEKQIVFWYVNALLDCGLDQAAKAVIREVKNQDFHISLNEHYYLQKEDLDSAIEWAKKGLRKSPDFYRLRFSLGDIYLRTGDLLDAERELQEALRTAEKNYDVTSDRLAAFVVLYRLLEDSGKEEFYLERALELDAELAYLILARLYNDVELWEEALNAANEALRLIPEWIFALSEYARTLMGMERYGEAIKTYQDLINKQPKNGKHWLGIAQGYQILGDKEKALESVRKALDTKNLSSIQKTRAIELENTLKESLVSE